MRTVIIDDEAPVREALKKLLTRCCPEVRITGEAESVRSGISLIRTKKPDLVLLDIKLDDGTGFDLLRSLEPIDFKVIFVTAYEEYAIRAFKFSALDYILKPIDPDDLAEAIGKVDKMLRQEFQTQLNLVEENVAFPDKSPQKIILKTSNQIFLVKTVDITYIESDGSYSTVHLINGLTVVVSRPLREYEEMLSGQRFFRVHKSYLVNFAHISRFDKRDGGFLILVNEEKVPVASRKREELLMLFEKMSG